MFAQSITPSGRGTQARINLNQSNQIDITGGTRSGGNLFHSFSQFGLNAGHKTESKHKTIFETPHLIEKV